jgi:hypothetical protein
LPTLDAYAQIGNRDAKGIDQQLHVDARDVALASLDGADVPAVQTGGYRNRLLG